MQIFVRATDGKARGFNIRLEAGIIWKDRLKSSTNSLLFVDGLLVASHGSAIPNPAQSDFLRFGKQYDGYAEYWPGTIDEVRIWNVARTPAALQTTMTNRLTGTEIRPDRLLALSTRARTRPCSMPPAAGHNGTAQGLTIWVPSTATNIQGLEHSFAVPAGD